jgi:S-DNA-T family DNA segregation ATPase FtsK/SpoIIIE
MSTTFAGRRLPAATVKVRREPLRLPLWLLIPWWLLKMAAKLLLIVARTPELLLLAWLGVLNLLVYDWAGGGIGATGVLIALNVWLGCVALGLCMGFPRLRSVLWSRLRWFSVYRYKWPATMDMVQLNRTRKNGDSYEPPLLSVRSTANVDRVRARLLAGQTLDQWAKASDGLRQTFGADDCRVRSVPGKPREVELWFLINDPLQNVIAPGNQEVPVRLDALPIGMREDGEVYRLPLLGNHVFVGGATGSGKSSVLQATIHALAPAIADGTVQLIGIDPKAMELAAGEALFARMAYRDPAEFATTLEEVVTIMLERRLRLRGHTRLHTPSQAEPLIVVLIDELAPLSLINDRDIKKRIDTALGLLLSQGRAVGISVIGCAQDPRKEVVSQRDLFTVRIALRLTEVEQVVLILGAAARDRGARCEDISPSLRGVGFVQVDGVAEPIRVRFTYITDDDIRTLVAGWRPELSAVPDPPEVEAA